MTSPSTDRRLGLLGSTALKTPVTVVAASNITQYGQQTIDGVAVQAVNAAGVPDRVLCAGQTDATQNGIWDVSLTNWTRSLDADGNYDFKNGTVAMVGSGTANAQTAWTLAATEPISPGSSVMAWAKAVWNTLAAALFLQAGTGAVARGSQDKMREAVSVKDFGATGDGVTDDGVSIDKAITYAALTSRDVWIPDATFLRSTTMNIPAGVIVRGAGRGSTVLGAGPTTGSILKYTGVADAVKLNGTLAGLENLSVVGTVAALGAGVLVNGDTNVVESWRLRNITIFGLTAGTGLKLQGINGGAVAYGSAFDVRIRNAKTGLNIVDTGGAGGFVNTNQFYGGAINGGGYDYAIRVQGGNDNRFFGMSVEPPSSTVGHLVIESGSITFDGRLEGSTQPTTLPLVSTLAGTSGSAIRGLGGSGLIKLLGDCDMSMSGGKHAEPARVPNNLFANACFIGADATAHTIPDWTVVETGGATTWTLNALGTGTDILPGHNVIQIDVPAGGNVELKPLAGVLPTIPTNVNVRSCTFGMWVKTVTGNACFARINSPTGVTSSGLHSGSGSYEAVSMQQAFANAVSADPRFEFPGGAGGATYYIAAPYFAYGNMQPRNASSLTQAGGRVYGTIEGAECTVTLPAAGDNDYYATTNAILTVPKWGNLVHVTGTARTITRLNSITNKMAAGTPLKLIFDIGGVVVTDGNPGFIDLTAAFTSAVPATPSGRSWLLLASNGDGTWYEMNRRA